MKLDLYNNISHRHKALELAVIYADKDASQEAVMAIAEAFYKFLNQP